MSLRDFNSTSFPDDPTSLHHGPAGNETGLENFHTVQPEDVEPNNTPRIIGAVAVALMVGAAGVALYTSQDFHSSKQIVAAAPSMPAPVAPPPAAAPVSDATMPASAPAASPETAVPVQAAAAQAKSAPVKSASAAKPAASSGAASSNASDAMAARMAAANDANQVNSQPQQQAAITAAPEQPGATPLPAGPSPSPSDVATNNTQSGISVPQGATSASDIPTPAPAQGADPAPSPTPEPTQPSAQPSGQIAQ